MPDMTGEQFVEAVRKLRADVPILLTSGYESHGQSEMIARLSVSAFIAKPFQTEDLARTLSSCLSSGQ